jgi:hypothetical protein
VTVPFTFQMLLWEQLRSIADHSLDLTLVCNPGQELDTVTAEVGADGARIPMQCRPAPLSDMKSLFKLTRFMYYCVRWYGVTRYMIE